jgi:NADPH2:quinone reductase
VRSSFGSSVPGNLVWVEVPDPAPGAGEILVSVAAAAVNRADLLFRSGRYHSGPPLPAIPGSEGAGTVVALGAGVEGFAVGDRVVAWGAIGAPGFYAELAVVSAHHALPVPAEVPCWLRRYCRSPGCRHGTACIGWPPCASAKPS